MKAIFVSDREGCLEKAYTPEQLALYPRYRSEEIPEEGLPGVDTVFSTWIMPQWDEETIAKRLPDLKYVFYGAGSVQYFARPFMSRGVRIFSAWQANAVPVYEFAAAQILLANKGYFQMHRRYKEDGIEAVGAYAETFDGNYHTYVGVLGAGMISTGMMRFLKNTDLRFKVLSRHLSDQDAAEMRAEKADLEDIFKTCRVVSNHLPDKEETAGLLNYDLFSTMKDNAVFINTGRGRQVDMDGLVRALIEQPGRTALLDVTWPEPLPLDHPIWKLPNVFITPHRAGAFGKEPLRLGGSMFEEAERVFAGQTPLYEVVEEMLKTMA